jgi:hypothetical protein
MARPRPVPPVAPPALTVYAAGHPEGNPAGLPTKDDVLKYIKHPHAVRGFDREGKAVWPDDQFTHRRIRDGDVTVETPKGAAGPQHKRVEHKPAQ